MPDGRDRNAGGREPAYSYEVHLRRAAPGARAAEAVVMDVPAPSLLDAYGRALADAAARAADPDDPWHGSRFACPPGVARRMEEARAAPGAAPAAPADGAAPPPREEPPGDGAGGAPPPGDGSARSLAEALTARSEDAGEEEAEEELPYTYLIRVTGTDPEGRQHTLLWRDWRGRSLLGSYRAVLDGLAADPERAGWRFEAQPFTVRARLAEQGPSRAARPGPIPEPDLVAERFGDERPPDSMSDEELASLDDTWR